MMASVAMSPEFSKGDQRRIFFLTNNFKFGLRGKRITIT
ncbi:hypothetical protein RLEG12_30515 [Rhizobium leguminosarum bv. trifolii CB782]|nr:hypothetical protein RLEG12_30515 [Rhizobium leguminosarum bv. trifolii CB782]